MRCLALAVAFAALSAAPSGATTLVRVSLEELARQASVVVTGHAEAAHAERDPATGLIVTVTRLHVTRVIAGADPGADIEVVTLGGHLDGMGQVVEGEARLAPGDDVALFLESRPQGRARIVAMSEGRFEVSGTAQSPLVTRPGGLAVVDPATGRYTTLKPVRLPLEDFAARVQAARASPSPTGDTP